MSNQINKAYTVKTAANYLGVCERSVAKLITDKKILHFRVGRSLRISHESMVDFVLSGGTDDYENGDHVKGQKRNKNGSFSKEDAEVCDE